MKTISCTLLCTSYDNGEIIIQLFERINIKFSLSDVVFFKPFMTTVSVLQLDPTITSIETTIS